MCVQAAYFNCIFYHVSCTIISVLNQLSMGFTSVQWIFRLCFCKHQGYVFCFIRTPGKMVKNNNFFVCLKGLF